MRRKYQWLDRAVDNLAEPGYVKGLGAMWARRVFQGKPN